MDGEWDFEGTAYKLIAYFDRQDQSVPDFAKGGHAARAWLRVMHSEPDDNGTDVTTVQALVQDETRTGSGWVELRLAFEQWARSRAS